MLGKNNTGKAQRSMAPLYRKFTEAEEQSQSQTLQELGSDPCFFPAPDASLATGSPSQGLKPQAPAVLRAKPPRDCRMSARASCLPAKKGGVMPTICWNFDPLGWPCLTQAEWASWIQAIMSIVAIASAIAIPMFVNHLQNRREDARQKQRRDSYALSFLGPVEDLFHSLTRAKRRISAADSPNDFEDIAEILTVPDELMERMQDMHELGKLGPLLQGAVVATRKSKELVAWEAFYHGSGGQAYDEIDGLVDLDEPEDSLPHLNRAIDLAYRTLVGIRAISPAADPSNNPG